MSSNLRVEPVREEDMPRCMEIVLESFSNVPIQSIIAGPNNPPNREANAQRHLRGFHEHAEKYPAVAPAGIKCIYTDAQTGEEKIIGFAEWFVWDRERTREEYGSENYILRLEWVEDLRDREYALELMGPEIEARRRRMKGRPFGLLMYLCVDPDFRKRGAGTALCLWGMERCKDLDIPAYLEASEEGMEMYKRLGWELLEDDDVMFPAMIWWPRNGARE